MFVRTRVYVCVCKKGGRDRLNFFFIYPKKLK